MEHALACGLCALGVSAAAAFGIAGIVWSSPLDERPRRATFCLFAIPFCVALAVFGGNLASRIP